jgi:hypothetical protein
MSLFSRPIARVLGALALLATFAAPALAETSPDLDAAASKPFTICDDQTYALCASAKCTMFNDVAYCQCDVRHGDSISLTQDYKKGDVCTFNARGKGNGYMVSTFSPPPQALKGGTEAIYTCDKETSNGTYAQCDGGICFQSSRGQKFPGLGQLDDKQIVCACPTTTANPDTAKLGYQILGPYPCEKDFFKYCKKGTANTNNGSTMYVGAPTGSAKQLTKILTGENPQFNYCTR